MNDFIKDIIGLSIPKNPMSFKEKTFELVEELTRYGSISHNGLLRVYKDKEIFAKYDARRKEKYVFKYRGKTIFSGTKNKQPKIRGLFEYRSQLFVYNEKLQERLEIVKKNFIAERRIK